MTSDQRCLSAFPWRYAAIEALPDGARWTQATDVWAYGLLVWELFTNAAAPPFRAFATPHALQAALCSDDAVLEAVLPRPECCPPLLWTSVVMRCLQRNPAARPTWAELVKTFPGPKDCKASVEAQALADEPRSAPMTYGL